MLRKNGINEESHDYSAKKLYTCFQKNGGSYVKLGQIITQLEHIIPQAYVRELEPLCQECDTSSFETVKRMIEKEYKKPLEEIFASFEKVPLGSASLAQVHKATLKDGTEVAVKVKQS